MENTNDIILEQLRNDYSALKSKVEKQAILNEKLLQSVFQSKVKSIHSVGWTSALCGLFVILVSPLAFHYNPALNLSWAFVVGTDIMMLVCIAYTWYFHSDVKAPEAGASLKEFAQNVKTLKVRYQNWIRVAYIMIFIWMGWMFTEMFMTTEDKTLTYFAATGVLVGAVIGGILGFRMDRNVIKNCDDIIAAIEE